MSARTRATAASASVRHIRAAGSRSSGRSRSITQPRVAPCTTTVTKITAKAVISIRSRPGMAVGRDRATARVTTPRIPAQDSTVDFRHPSGRTLANSMPRARIGNFSRSMPKTQTGVAPDGRIAPSIYRCYVIRR